MILPAKREVSESGFQAQWQSSWFANNLGERFASGNDTGWENFPAFSVAVTTPADQYQLTDRATKYAILLIALTFMAFFVLKRSPRNVYTQCNICWWGFHW